jgi:hypothetical protein
MSLKDLPSCLSVLFEETDKDKQQEKKFELGIETINKSAHQQ